MNASEVLHLSENSMTGNNIYIVIKSKVLHQNSLSYQEYQEGLRVVVSKL